VKRSGPPPQPPELRLLRGNPGKRRITPRAVEPAPGARCPKWLDPAAKREWRRLAPELERLGVLRIVDRAVFACYCEAVAEYQWATEEVRRGGRIGQVKNGAEYVLPAVTIATNAAKRIRDLAGEFGMTPAARGRVTFPGNGKEADPDEQFFGPRPIPPPPASRRPKGTDRTKDQGHTNED